MIRATRDTEFECMEHGWRSSSLVCPFCMAMIKEEDNKALTKEVENLTSELLAVENYQEELLVLRADNAKLRDDMSRIANVGTGEGEVADFMARQLFKALKEKT